MSDVPADSLAMSASGVPRTVSPRGDAEQAAPRRTAPIGLMVDAIRSLRQMVLPIVAGYFAFRDQLSELGALAAIALAIVAINLGLAYLGWLRRTYTTGAEDIRVESGIVSRTARSVPYERIQDVSLEQKFLARIFGLVEVKFETGAGGADDLTLSYLTEAEGEALRRLIRERREEELDASEAVTGVGADQPPLEQVGETLFSMDARRLVTFGLFEFSLAVFAVLGGVAQYLDTFAGIELWNPDVWLDLAESQQGKLAALGPLAQTLSAIAGLLVLLAVGSGTGLVRTFLRDWGFVLEKTARGFRRRRGLFTRTDVVMPRHRVQAVEIGTGLIRYRFGWQSLKFVSLAQDAGSSSHVVAPFAQAEEIVPIVRAAGFAPPSEDLDWRQASRRYRNDSALVEGGFFLLLAIPAAIFAPLPFLLVPLGLATFFAAANIYAWQFHRHALSATQIFGRRGLLSPRTQVASRVKLHSVEIAQGPIARRRGYATLHMGLAGGTFSIPGLPLERARAVRNAILDSIAAKDFSALA